MFLKNIILVTCVFAIGCTNHKVKQGATNSKITNINKKNSVNTQKPVEKAKSLEIKSELPANLVKYMEAALNNNKEIKASQSGLMADHEDYNIAQSSMMPKLVATGSLSQTDTWSKETSDLRSPYHKIDTKREFTRGEAGLTAGYNIFRGGADISALKEQTSKINAAHKQHDALVQKILRNVVEYYFEIIAKQMEMELLDTLLAARKENIKVANEMLNAGSAKEMDVAQANAGYSETEARISKVEAEYKTAIAKLESITGIRIESKLDLPSRVMNKKLKLNEALDIAIIHNPQILEAEAKCKLAKSTFEKVDSEFAPSLDIEAGITGRNDLNNSIRKVDPTESNNSETHQFEPQARLSLRVPIVDGGKSAAEKKKTNSLITKALVEKGLLLQNIKAEIISTLEYLEAAEENIVSAQKAIESRNLALKATEEEHQAGTKIMNDVLDAQQKLFEAKLMLTNAMKEQFVRECVLLSLIGQLTPKSLNIAGSNFNYDSQFKSQKQNVFNDKNINLRDYRKRRSR